jgi:hypothetical protein
MEDELLQALKDFVATSNSGKYGNEKELLSKFPELQNYDTSVLKDFVATSNSGKYGSEQELLSKFPEFNTTVKKKEGFIGPDLASDMEQKLPIPPTQDGSLATSAPNTQNPKPTPEERVSDLDFKEAELSQLKDNLAERDTVFANINNYERATSVRPEDAQQIERDAQEKLDGSTFEKFTQGAVNVLSKIGTVATLGLGPDIKFPSYKERKQEKAIKFLEEQDKEQTPENISSAIKQITIKDETDALRERRTIDYIGSLPEKDREELNVNQVFNYKTVEMEEKAAVIDLEIDFEKLTRVASRVNSNEDFIRQMNKEGKELPEGFNETYAQNFELRSQIVTTLDDKYKKFEEKLEQNQDKKIETTEAIDLIKRNYGFVDNMKAQIAMSTGDLVVAGSQGAFAYALNIKAAITGNESDQIASDEMAMSAEETKKMTQEVAQNFRPRMEYYNITGLQDVGYFIAQETVTQAPILAAIMNPFSATAGITALGISTGGSKFSEMKSEESGINPANYSLLQEISIPFGYGAAESVLGALPTSRILRRSVSSSANRALLNKGALGFTKQFFKDNGVEVLTENATTFSQNLLDRFALDKKDVLLTDNLDKTTFSTLASSPLIIGGGKITGELIKPFMPKSQIEEIKNGYLKVIKLQKAFNNAGNQSTRNILEGKIKEANASNDKLIQKAQSSTSNLSEAAYNKVNGITKNQAFLQVQAKLINEDKALSQEQRTEILKDLLDEFNGLEKDRNEILEGKQMVVDEKKESFLDLLTEEESLRLKGEAQNEIIAEYEADGVKDFQITDQEITERAISIFERQEGDNPEVNTETQINQNPENNEESNEESSQEANDEEINTEEEEDANQEDVLNEQEIAREARESAQAAQEAAQAVKQALIQEQNDNLGGNTTISETIEDGYPYVKDGKTGFIIIDGQRVVFSSDDSIIDLGNKDEISESKLNEFGILREKEVSVSISDENQVTIDGEVFNNNLSTPSTAIIKTKSGNYSVTLENSKGNKRTFRGRVAEEIAYQTRLKEFYENSSAEQQAEADRLTEKSIAREKAKQFADKRKAKNTRTSSQDQIEYERQARKANLKNAQNNRGLDKISNEAQTEGNTSTDADVRPTDGKDAAKEKDSSVQPSAKPKPSQAEVEVKEEIIIVDDIAENENANEKLTEKDNAEQEPDVAAIESEAETTESLTEPQTEEKLGQVQEKINEATDVENVEMSELSTDEESFQNRDGLNEDKVDEIVEKYNPSEFDPISYWVNEIGQKITLNHHRFAAAIKLGFKTIPARALTYPADHKKAGQVVPPSDRAEAIDFAKVRSNANRSMETPLERAKILRKKRENGDSKADLDAFKKKEGRNKTFIESLSFLNPKGLVVQALKAFEKSTDVQNQREIEKISDWIGSSRKRNKELTNAHERELFSFLNNKNQSKRFRSKADFLSKITAITGEMFFDPKKPLNIARFKNKSEGETQYDKDVENQKSKISDLEKRKTEIKERLNNPANPQYINPNSSDYDQISKTSNKVLDKIEQDLRFERKKLQEIFQKKGKYTNAGSNQGGLFEDPFLKGLEDAEKQLKDFGDGTLGINLPVAIAIKAIQVVKVAYKAGKKAALALEEGLNYIKSTDWYKSLTKKEQREITTDTIKKAVAEASMTDEEAFDFVENNFDEADAAFENKQPRKAVRRKIVRKLIEKITDRQFLSKKLVDEAGAQQTKDAMVNSHGASGKARRIFDKAYSDIYTDRIKIKVKGGFEVEFRPMSNADRVLLDKIIQLKRFIAIDKNRSAKGLPTVKHPGFVNGIIAQKYLNSAEQKIGTKKYKDLENRAKIYFDTYKSLLDEMRNNGLISQKVYDDLSGLDYQPRLFLQHITDFEGNVSLGAAQTEKSDTGGLSQNQIKNLNEGSSGNLVRNSEWLLSTSIVSRQRAMAMNTVNKVFMTKEFPAAKKRFDALKKNLSNRKEWTVEDERFYEYFIELNRKIKDNPIIKKKENTERTVIDGMVPEFIYERKFKKTPSNFKKAFYYVDGIRNEFFIEEELHNSWFDNLSGFLNSRSKEGFSYVSGSALLKGIATGNNPAFALVNIPRDFIFNVVFSDQYSSNVFKAMFQVSKDTFIAINEIRKSKGNYNMDSSNMLDNYIYYGGDMAFLSTQGRLKKDTVLAKTLDRLITPRVKAIGGSLFKAVTLRKLSNYSEIMFRMALFKRTIKNQLDLKGLKSISEVKSQEEKDAIYMRAVAEARSLLDFNQGGAVTKDLEAFVPYINTATQGSRVAVDAFKKNPQKITSKILQAGVILSGSAVVGSLALIAKNKDEEDKDKSPIEIWLEAMEGVSRYQRIQYFNIVDGTKNEDGEYRIWKIAKNQQLAPILNIADNVYTQLINQIVGKERKDSKVNYAEAWTAIQNNIIPIDITSLTANLAKIPTAKAALTYTTGYDFYRNQPLTFDQNQDIPEMEGAKDKNIDDFYKQIGRSTHLSPSRLKGSIESLITTPSTNPFIGVLYAGADAVANDDKDVSKIGSDLGNDLLKSFNKRLISHTSGFNRQVNRLRPIQGDLKNIKIKNAYREIDVEALASSFYNDEISVPAFIEALKGYAPKELERVESKIKSIAKYKDVDRYVIGLAFENDREARALKIVQYYGNVFDGSAKNDKVFDQMLKMNIFDDETIKEYTELMDKIKKDK